MTFSDDSDHREQADLLAQTAIAVVNRKSRGEQLSNSYAVTFNFHPDVSSDGQSVVESLVQVSVYRSQFETATSNGGLSAHRRGQRWQWEHKLFDGVYDAAPAATRPKYGALNYTDNTFGGAPRFGSAHLRLKSHILDNCTFAYPDSHFDPESFGTKERMSLIRLADENKAKFDLLDNYIETHVHGIVDMQKDVAAIVLDPSYRDTPIESAAARLRIDVEWHAGFCLAKDCYAVCAAYRGEIVADFIHHIIASDGQLTPALLGAYRERSVDAQVLKKAWHCLARFGGPLRQPN